MAAAVPNNPHITAPYPQDMLEMFHACGHPIEELPPWGGAEATAMGRFGPGTTLEIQGERAGIALYVETRKGMVRSVLLSRIRKSVTESLGHLTRCHLGRCLASAVEAFRHTGRIVDMWGSLWNYREYGWLFLDSQWQIFTFTPGDPLSEIWTGRMLLFHWYSHRHREVQQNHEPNATVCPRCPLAAPEAVPHTIRDLLTDQDPDFRIRGPLRARERVDWVGEIAMIGVEIATVSAMTTSLLVASTVFGVALKTLINYWI